MAGLGELLRKYRDAAPTQRDMGTAFERLVKVWLENAPTQREQYGRVLTYADWAAERGEDRGDIGIDLCAELPESPGRWCAIQCKYRAEGTRIRKEDIDSFFNASGRDPFSRRLFVDTTGVNWSEPAEAMLAGQQVETLRVGLHELEDSGIDWNAWLDREEVRLYPRKQPRQHQREAVEAVREGFSRTDRGKLIMACGTGKTFTALKIAEDLVGKGRRVLFLVPSLALMSQTVREWSIDSETPLRSYAVCSDSQVGVRKPADDDLADISASDLEIPASTRANVLAAHATRDDAERMTVVFATYQSLEVVAQAQRDFGLPAFDLIVCDEAHRTTGASLGSEDESSFIKVHDAAYLLGRRRLYMTATPRVFGEKARSQADKEGIYLASMDDPALFGETFFVRSFAWAVEKGLLADYKVMVLAVDQEAIARGVRVALSDGGTELNLDDATRIVGCYKALLKAGLAEELGADAKPMGRAIAFANSIKASQLFEGQFARVASEWRAAMEALPEAEALPALRCEVRHVDGGFQAKARDALLSWLRESPGEGECRILTNARCLSEGVDVPALDAVLFLHPRKSQIDVVQAVGRVMRTAPGKRMGYVILPVAVAPGVDPADALDANERYRVIWQILNALRSHDERLDGAINRMGLGEDAGDRLHIEIVTDTLPRKSERKAETIDIGEGGAGDEREPPEPPAEPEQLAFQFDEWKRAIRAAIVKRCGTRTYWEDWAKDVADIAAKHIARIKAAIADADGEAAAAFRAFLAEIRDDLNDSITEEEAVEMLAQHLITRPVFEALFEGYSFAEHNPVSRALQGVLDALEGEHLEKEAAGLEGFYDSVRRRAAGVETAEAKQKIIVELYDKFFRTAFKRTTDRLGIVYTPVEVVDFIIRSVDELLRAEFGQTLGSEGVHIIDPFVGTGTFITRLLQSGLIAPEELPHKYAHEIHANEIVLLAYYIAAINIEATFHGIAGSDYRPFEGICLTDTFQLYEQERDLVSDLMADNSNRRTRQRDLDIRVIVGNPPYSVGQESANDNAANLSYPKLDRRIAETYAARSDATNKNGLYNSYIRAFRWASDRIGAAGIVAFVSNGGWIDGNAADGLRKCFADEFSSIHVFHLRGNQRTSGERSRKEGGKIFGQGSRTPIAITFLVKNPAVAEQGRIFFHDIGDYLSREQKLAIIEGFGSIEGLTRAGKWQAITPDEHGDWIAQRDTRFSTFIAMGDKDSGGPAIFETYSRGVATGRDAWAFNPSRQALEDNMRRMIGFYNAEVDRFDAAQPEADQQRRAALVDEFVNADPKKISWSDGLKTDLVRGRRHQFRTEALMKSLYRPFSPQWLYYDRGFNERVYQMPRFFPFGAEPDNRVIMVGTPGGKVPFSALMTKAPPALHAVDMGGSQCFARWVFESAGARDGELGLEFGPSALVRKDSITPEGLAHFQAAYPGEAISSDDIFHYVYGLLHAPDYRARFADNLTKELPRIPLVRRVEDFRAFVDAGRRLGDLHADFDAAAPYPVTYAEGALELAVIDDPVAYYRVEKMRFAGKRPNLDRTTVLYNPRITITGIPLEAYDYVVNGKPALEWVMERQGVKTDSASGIIWDANRYAIETVGDPAYPLLLFRRVITISLETMKIVRSLPPLDIREDG